jgi:MFS family permease
MNAAVMSRSSAPVDRQRFFSVFGAVMLPMFLSSLDQTVVATATPSIGHELGHIADMSWLAVSYLIASVTVVPLYGQAGDRFGRRRLLAVAILVFTLGSLACGMATSFDMLVAGRVLQGLGGGGLNSLSQALIGEVLPPQHRARFQGWFSIVFISASLLGPLIGAGVVAHASWRWMFLANLPFAAFALWRLWSLPATGSTRPSQGRYDAESMLAFSLAIISTLLLLTEAGHGLSMATTLVGTVAVVAAWALLCVIERHTVRSGRPPFLPVELLAEPTVRRAGLAVIGFGAVMFASLFYLPVYLHLALGGDMSASALLLLPLTGGMVAGAAVTGRLVARTGRLRELPVAGLLLAGTALALMGVLPPDQTSVTMLSALAGLGLGTVMPVMQIVTQVVAGPARLGAAAATLSLSRSLGASIGAAGFGALVLGGQGDIDLAALRAQPELLQATLQSFHLGFAVAAGVAVLTAWTVSRLPVLRLDSPGTVSTDPLPE